MRKSLAVAVVVGLLAICGVGFGLGLAKKAGHEAVRLYATGFEDGVTLPAVDTNGNADQYLEGGDFKQFRTPLDLWRTPQKYRGWILSIVGHETPMPSSAYIENTIKTVTSRNGAPTRALSLLIKENSPKTNVQAVNFQSTEMAVEPVLYQRMWIKFDTDLLTHAKTVGERDFWRMFWEIKAEPDYRIRLQVQYSEETGLYWQAQGDALVDAEPLWSGELKKVPVVLAPHDAPAGWHKVEIWMDRPGGHFKASIDGQTLVDYKGKLMGKSGNRIDQLRFAKVYGNGPLPAELLVDDLEIWNVPPPDAWSH